MQGKLLSSRFILTGIFLVLPLLNYGQTESTTRINGKLQLDDSWGSKIYLSLIPIFDDMYLMSDEMIIATADIDSVGNFRFEMDFLPEGENLYRFHLAKKGDDRATLIIGGRDENHSFFIIDHPAQIEFQSASSEPPFRKVSYAGSPENVAFQILSDMIFSADSIGSRSSASKRGLIQDQFETDIKALLDTSSHFLVSLYAINQLPLGKTLESNPEIYQSFMSKWDLTGNGYFEEFKRKIPESAGSNSIWVYALGGVILLFGGLLIFVRLQKKQSKLHSLSIQERKVFDLVYQGMSNQEIADELNIGLSTVKSHVSSIYSKLNIKSRKEILQVK